MRPKNTVPPPPTLVRQDAAMDTKQDEEPGLHDDMDTTPSDEDRVDTTTTKPQKKTKKRNYNEWYTHVNKVKEENPGITHADAVRKAKETYTKAPKAKRDTSGYKPNPWMEHIANWINAHPEWRKEYSYKDVLKEAKKTYKTI